MLTKLMLMLAVINLVFGVVQGLIGRLDIAIIHGIIFGAALFSIRNRSTRASEELEEPLRRVK